MSDLPTVYRHQMIRAVLGTHPAMLAKEADPIALDCMSRRMADAEEAVQLLCAKGYGAPSQSLVDLVRALPPHSRALK
jgi:hypothetical protein